MQPLQPVPPAPRTLRHGGTGHLAKVHNLSVLTVLPTAERQPETAVWGAKDPIYGP